MTTEGMPSLQKNLNLEARKCNFQRSGHFKNCAVFVALKNFSGHHCVKFAFFINKYRFYFH